MEPRAAGSKFFLGSKEATEVVDNDGIRTGRERSDVFGLKVAKHGITVVYFQELGGQGDDIRYMGPASGGRPFRPRAFFALPNVGAQGYVG